jgi:hypothetical protein
LAETGTSMVSPTFDEIRQFFAWSDTLDYLVLRPLSHITASWEMTWDPVANCYEPEQGTFAADLNAVIELIATHSPPANYHNHEDHLAEAVVRDLGWPIQKRGTRWMGADYVSILEQGAFRNLQQFHLIAAASGRVQAAFKHGQTHMDDMEDAHRWMLTALMTIAIYHRYCDGSSIYSDVQ